MKRLFLFCLSILALRPGPATAAVNTFSNSTTSVFYYNSGTSQDSPPIDAFNFVNSGTFTALNLNFGAASAFEGIFTIDQSFQNFAIVTLSQSPPLPFETSSTLNYTNTGTIQAGGIRFRNTPANLGVARPSRWFVNGNLGSVSADSLLKIDATNIINRGTLNISAAGIMEIDGSSVDLA